MKQCNIIFAGHFTVGEYPTLVQKQTIANALQLGGDLGIVVNDIDLKRRLQFYAIGGKEMVIRHYGNRKKCGTTKTLCELPDFQKIPELIDWDFYDETLKILDASIDDIDTTLRTQVVPNAIVKQLAVYELSLSDVRIYTERSLRNYARRHLRSSTKGERSWKPYLEAVGLADGIQATMTGTPVCGAILLSLYEQLTQLGYTQCMQLYSESDRGPLENAARIYALLHDAFPADPRWQLNVDFQLFT